MSSYTLLNLLDVDDSVAGRIPGLEGRFARTLLESRDLGVSHFRYAPNSRSSRGHRHGVQEEAYVVVGGSGQALLDGEVRDLHLWDVLRVAPATVRAFAAGGDGLDLIIVGGPKPESSDGEMLDVTWPGQG